MSRKKEYFLMCVYIIKFTNYHKVYIGSSIRWPYRKREHLHALENKKHINRYLQRAFNKHGIENILVEELEFCNTELNLRLAEQKWINFYKSTDKNYGFNMVKDVTQPGTRGLKLSKKTRKKISIEQKKRFTSNEAREKMSERTISFSIQNPEAFKGKFLPKSFELFNASGELIKITNLRKFCRNNNLSYEKMYKVATDDIIEYNGWKLSLDRINECKKKFVFLSPKNERIEIFGLRKFCLDNNLHYRTMQNIHNNIGVSCQGWKKFQENGSSVYHKGKPFAILNPNAEIIIGNNLKHFCKENGISYDSLRKMGNCKNFILIPKI